MTVFDASRIVAVVATKLLHFYITRLILMHKEKGGANIREYALIILIPFVSIISMSIIMSAVLENSGIAINMLSAMAGIVLTNFVTYVLFNMIQKKNLTEVELRLENQNYNNEIENIKNMQTLYEETKSLSHDLKEHLTVLGSLIESDKKAEAIEYINRISKTTRIVRQGDVDTENSVFNAIVNAKLVIANRYKIYTEIRVMKNSLASIASDDIGILFGNLFENAIRAANDSEERRVALDIRLQGEYVSVFMRNSIKKSVLSENSSLTTTKKDKSLHGFGIKSIRRVVDKYDGMIEFFENEGEFCCDILLSIHT